MRFGRDGIRPGRAIRAQQILLRRTSERFAWRSEPDIRLWIHGFAANAIHDFLRSHVDPLHVDHRIFLLKFRFVKLEQVDAVRRVDGQYGSVVMHARAERRRRHGQGDAQPSAAKLHFNRFANIRAPPGTAAGSWRNSASVTYVYRPFPTVAVSIPALFADSPGSFMLNIAGEWGSKVVGMYVARSCTQPAKSAFVIRFGESRSEFRGSSIVTGAFSSVTRAAGRASVIGYGFSPHVIHQVRVVVDKQLARLVSPWSDNDRAVCR